MADGQAEPPPTDNAAKGVIVPSFFASQGMMASDPSRL